VSVYKENIEQLPDWTGQLAVLIWEETNRSVASTWWPSFLNLIKYRAGSLKAFSGLAKKSSSRVVADFIISTAPAIPTAYAGLTVLLSLDTSIDFITVWEAARKSAIKCGKVPEFWAFIRDLFVVSRERISGDRAFNLFSDFVLDFAVRDGSTWEKSFTNATFETMCVALKPPEPEWMQKIETVLSNDTNLCLYPERLHAIVSSFKSMEFTRCMYSSVSTMFSNEDAPEKLHRFLHFLYLCQTDKKTFPIHEDGIRKVFLHCPECSYRSVFCSDPCDENLLKDFLHFTSRPEQVTSWLPFRPPCHASEILTEFVCNNLDVPLLKVALSGKHVNRTKVFASIAHADRRDLMLIIRDYACKSALRDQNVLEWCVIASSDSDWSCISLHSGCSLTDRFVDWLFDQNVDGDELLRRFVRLGYPYEPLVDLRSKTFLKNASINAFISDSYFDIDLDTPILTGDPWSFETRQTLKFVVEKYLHILTNCKEANVHAFEWIELVALIGGICAQLVIDADRVLHEILSKGKFSIDGYTMCFEALKRIECASELRTSEVAAMHWVTRYMKPSSTWILKNIPSFDCDYPRVRSAIYASVKDCDPEFISSRANSCYKRLLRTKDPLDLMLLNSVGGIPSGYEVDSNELHELLDDLISDERMDVQINLALFLRWLGTRCRNVDEYIWIWLETYQFKKTNEFVLLKCILDLVSNLPILNENLPHIQRRLVDLWSTTDHDFPQLSSFIAELSADLFTEEQV
jgi:hypothetical protein